MGEVRELSGPTNGGAVPQGPLQLGEERRRGPHGRANQLAVFGQSEVEGDVCSRQGFGGLDTHMQIKTRTATPGLELLLVFH